MTEADDTTEGTSAAPPSPDPDLTPAHAPFPSAEPAEPAEPPSIAPSAWAAPAPPAEVIEAPVAAPTQPLPAVAPAWTPTVEPIPPVPRASSVVVGVDPSPAPRKSGAIVAWSLAALFGIAALVLGFLFFSASSDADDAESERDDALAELDDTSERLTAAEQNATDLEGTVDDLEGQVSDLQAEVDEIAAELESKQLSDEHAMAVGTWLWGPDDPLSNADATCLGKEFAERVDHSSWLFYMVTPEDDDIPRAVFEEIDDAFFDAATECGIEL